MSKIAPCLWFDGEAEEAAKLYVSLLPNSRIDHVQKNVTDSPAGKAGSVLIVKFTLAGQRFLALNGGTRFEYTHAISFQVDCADQAEVDRLWDGLSDGGSTERCGWLKDRYGVSWQIVPNVLPQLLGDPDPAKAQRVMQAMLQMIKLDIAGLKAAHAGAVGA
jgi:predicted 3-demethylubiquinone-9 3-methyltransferase (glyoxalase superfamily)